MKYFQLNNGASVPCIGNGPMILGYDNKHFQSQDLKDRVFRKLFYKGFESEKYVKTLDFWVYMLYNNIVNDIFINHL